MEYKIKISSGDIEIEASLNDTSIAAKLKDILPISANANTWGDEIYFGIPLDESLENPQEVVEAGDIGYWPPGHAFCIFFGITPASRGTEIRAASSVTVIGKVLGDSALFKKVTSGEAIKLELSD